MNSQGKNNPSQGSDNSGNNASPVSEVNLHTMFKDAKTSIAGWVMHQRIAAVLAGYAVVFFALINTVILEISLKPLIFDSFFTRRVVFQFDGFWDGTVIRLVGGSRSRGSRSTSTSFDNINRLFGGTFESSSNVIAVLNFCIITALGVSAFFVWKKIKLRLALALSFLAGMFILFIFCPLIIWGLHYEEANITFSGFLILMIGFSLIIACAWAYKKHSSLFPKIDSKAKRIIADNEKKSIVTKFNLLIFRDKLFLGYLFIAAIILLSFFIPLFEFTLGNDTLSLSSLVFTNQSKGGSFFFFPVIFFFALILLSAGLLLREPQPVGVLLPRKQRARPVAVMLTFITGFIFFFVSIYIMYFDRFLNEVSQVAFAESQVTVMFYLLFLASIGLLGQGVYVFVKNIPGFTYIRQESGEDKH